MLINSFYIYLDFRMRERKKTQVFNYEIENYILFRTLRLRKNKTQYLFYNKNKTHCYNFEISFFFFVFILKQGKIDR